MNDRQVDNRFQSEAVRGILLAMAGSVATSHFIGRTGELDRLRAAFESTRVGDPVTCAERARRRKTRLVNRFADTSARQAVWYWSAAAFELGEGSLPYGPVIQALRGLGRRLDSAVLARSSGRTDPGADAPELWRPTSRESAAGRRSSPRVSGQAVRGFSRPAGPFGETIPDSVGDRGPALGRPLDAGLAHVFGPQSANGITPGADLPHRRPAPPPSGPSLPRRTGPQRAG